MTKASTNKFRTRSNRDTTPARTRKALRRLALPALAVAAWWVAVPAADAAQAFLPGKIYYAIGKPVCHAPKRDGRAQCFAMRRVVVDKKTAGARAFRPAGGAVGNGTIGPAGGLTPTDLAGAYTLPTTGGAGQTVAIVDAYNDPNIQADLQIFDSEYHLPICDKFNGCLQVVSQTGSATSLPPNDTTGWSIEESLDVETVHAVCQKCKIILVEANSNGFADLGTAENEAVALGATVVSNSFGGPESNASSIFQAAFYHPKVVITASTGDDGYYDFDELAGVNEPNFPATSPYVVSVGGTSLYLGEFANRQSETVWNDNGTQDYWQRNFGQKLGAAGGGCSTIFTARSWQTGVAGWNSTACGNKRLAADIAAVADYLTGLDIYHSYACGGCGTPGWETVGGTSLAAPLIGAAFALAGGANGVSFPAQTLYQNIGQAYDVTVGGNGWCDGEGAGACTDPNDQGYGIVDCAYNASTDVKQADGSCDALEGYDGPTGVGTPNGLGIVTPE